MTEAFDGGEHTFVTTHRLRFNDTDKLGHVNNAVFAVMLEQGRAELMELAGLPVGGSDQAVVIVRMELDFLAEMAWPGDVRIETVVSRLGGRSFQMQQRLVSAGAVCGQALTVMVVMDRAARKAVSIDPWRESLSRWLVADGA
jgi:acyl-CoA thioester hydrolase